MVGGSVHSRFLIAEVCDWRWFFVCSYRMPCTPINYICKQPEKAKQIEKQTKQTFQKSLPSFRFIWNWNGKRVRSNCYAIGNCELKCENPLNYIQARNVTIFHMSDLEFLHFRPFGYALDVRMSKTRISSQSLNVLFVHRYPLLPAGYRTCYALTKWN